jgi:hypothetical protein
MEDRCNQLMNCRDMSDEKDCQLLVLDKHSYNMRVPPIVQTGGNNFQPAEVAVSIFLLKIVSMEEEAHKIELQFTITLQWKENRATYYNLKTNTALNSLSAEDINTIWLPLITYANTDQLEVTRLGVDWEWMTTVTVSKEGGFTRSPLEMLEEIEIFRGDENTLSMTQSYTWEFQCHYELAKYPFDTQVSLFLSIGLPP